MLPSEAKTEVEDDKEDGLFELANPFPLLFDSKSFLRDVGMTVEVDKRVLQKQELGVVMELSRKKLPPSELWDAYKRNGSRI